MILEGSVKTIKPSVNVNITLARLRKYVALSSHTSVHLIRRDIEMSFLENLGILRSDVMHQRLRLLLRLVVHSFICRGRARELMAMD